MHHNATDWHAPAASPNSAATSQVPRCIPAPWNIPLQAWKAKKAATAAPTPAVSTMGSADPTVEYAPPKPSEFGYDAREYERQLQANQRDAEMRKARRRGSVLQTRARTRMHAYSAHNHKRA